MAIKINNNTVIDDSQNFIGVGLTLTGPIYISGSPGSSGQVIKSTGSGLQWADDNTGGGGAGGSGSGSFDSGITTSVFVSVTSGIATGIGTAGISTALSQTTRNNDIFIGPGIAFSFPSTVGVKYVIESIHLTNTFANELYVSGRQDYNGGRNIPIANKVIVPYQGATELLEQPAIASPSDIIRLQAFTGIGSTASGIDGSIDGFIVYSRKSDTKYVGIGSTVTNASGQEIYTASTYQTVLQSIRLVNYNNNIDVDTSVSIYRGGTVGGILTTGVRQGYLAYNLTVPRNSTVEILEQPKYLAIRDSIVVGAAASNSIAIHIAGLGYT